MRTAITRDPLWCDVLRRMLRDLAGANRRARRTSVIKRLDGERDEFYEAQASKLLAGITFGPRPRPPRR